MADRCLPWLLSLVQPRILLPMRGRTVGGNLQGLLCPRDQPVLC